VHILALVAGIVLIYTVLLDAFQTIVLPRHASHRVRITSIFYALTWRPWVAASRLLRTPKKQESAFSFYGPLSLLLLLAVWAFGLVFSFAFFYYAIGTPFSDTVGLYPFRTAFYVSGTTLFTLGLGDVVPRATIARELIVVEAGLGLGFLAVVVGYLPVLYGAFSRREVSISLLDARAGSPPTAAEIMRRHAFPGGDVALTRLFIEWERWSAELLESHISYPLLCYFRSQHDNQSWISALTSVLDATALSIAVVKTDAARQAQLTFAMARHAVVDLSQIFIGRRPPGYGKPVESRLTQDRFETLRSQLAVAGLTVCSDPASLDRLAELRAMYESHVQVLSDYLCMPLPPWVADRSFHDNWRTVARLRSETEAIASTQSPALTHDEEHHAF
jgi:hypothetical protein